MSIYESVGQASLESLLSEINSGSTRLPDFQRDFVWDPNNTAALIESIASDYPAGSILRVRDTQQAFATRTLEGAPKTNIRPAYLILDGQQRLTSLYQALYGVGKYRFFIDLEKIKKSEDISEANCIFFEKANKKLKGRKTVDETMVESYAYHATHMILPLSMIHGPKRSFHKWVSNVRRTGIITDIDQFELDMDNLYTRFIKAIETYQFPTVTLSGATSVEALCTIFETLNKTGMKLTVFELLTARFWKDGIDLRKLWNTATDTYPILDDYGVEAYPILQAISLIVGPNATCKKKDVLALTDKNIKDNWDRVVKNMIYGLEILRDDCKIMNSKWLPTAGMLGPLAAILSISESIPGPHKGVRRAQVARWLWCSILGQRYEAAANTRGEKDVNEMRSWFKNNKSLPEAISQFRFDKEILREVSTRSGSVYKGIICLTLKSGGGSLDFHTGASITQQMVASNYVDDHHIFPKNYLLQVKKIKDRTLRDCVLYRTLIDRDTNKNISDKAPSKYLAKFQLKNIEKVLASHLIPVGDKSPLLTNNYEKFLEQRTALIMEQIEKVTK